LSQISTEELKNKTLELTQGRDTESLHKKSLVLSKRIVVLFDERRRNPFHLLSKRRLSLAYHLSWAL